MSANLDLQFAVKLDDLDIDAVLPPVKRQIDGGLSDTEAYDIQAIDPLRQHRPYDLQPLVKRVGLEA